MWAHSFRNDPPTYAQSKSKAFERYQRKIQAIVSNIKSNSLKDKDKKKLIKKLISDLEKSLNEI